MAPSRAALVVSLLCQTGLGSGVLPGTECYRFLYNMGAKVIGIPMTAEGMNLELLEKNLHLSTKTDFYCQHFT